MVSAIPVIPATHLMSAAGIDLSKEFITMDEFNAAGIPMVVACKYCFTTMDAFSAYVEPDGSAVCGGCCGH